ncbi:hypothetical protein VN97_g9070 [Penicillium thymicola]|uniref:Uncharacterized protein n=1 Tax=Penicillium thymicola TaxID=293382 RepID=A0AAI9TBJ4_PENTH|nr:hypothetical protein VN97_g9070 [Penicillium thymicola]
MYFFATPYLVLPLFCVPYYPLISFIFLVFGTFGSLFAACPCVSQFSASALDFTVQVNGKQYNLVFRCIHID